MVATAAQAVMDEAFGRFTLSFGRDGAPFGVLDPFIPPAGWRCSIYSCTIRSLLSPSLSLLLLLPLELEPGSRSRRSEASTVGSLAARVGSNCATFGHTSETGSIGSRNGPVFRRDRRRLNIQAPPTIHTNAKGGGPARFRPFLTSLTSMSTFGAVTIERKLSVLRG